MSLVGDLISSVFERRFRAALSDEAAGRTVMELVRDLLSTSVRSQAERLQGSFLIATNKWVMTKSKRSLKAL